MEFVNMPLICITLLFILMDVVTGFAQACENHCVDSTILKEGLWHKCGFMFAIMFGILCEYAMGIVELGFTLPVSTAVCSYIILTEITSILENLGKLSPELSDKGFMKIFTKVDKK